jgi:hypothetical protein
MFKSSLCGFDLSLRRGPYFKPTFLQDPWRELLQQRDRHVWPLSHPPVSLTAGVSVQPPVAPATLGPRPPAKNEEEIDLDAIDNDDVANE